ncbi:hypothetical protein C8J57DRAFT_1463137, partial [Mycena rebaudengoi]
MFPPIFNTPLARAFTFQIWENSEHELLDDPTSLPASPTGWGPTRWGRRGRIKEPPASPPVSPSAYHLSRVLPPPSYEPPVYPGSRSRASVTQWHRPPPARSSLALTPDAILLSLTVLKESSDVLPPLKAVVGGVLAVWNVVQRAAAVDEEAKMLAWRAFTILDAIYTAIGDADAEALSSAALRHLIDFERLLYEIRDAMEAMTNRHARNRVARFLSRGMSLQRSESDLARFNKRLDAAAQALTIGSLTRVEVAVEKVRVELSTLTLSLQKSQALMTQQLRQVKVLSGLSFFWPDPTTSPSVARWRATIADNIPSVNGGGRISQPGKALGGGRLTANFLFSHVHVQLGGPQTLVRSAPCSMSSGHASYFHGTLYWYYEYQSTVGILF